MTQNVLYPAACFLCGLLLAGCGGGGAPADDGKVVAENGGGAAASQPSARSAEPASKASDAVVAKSPARERDPRDLKGRTGRQPQTTPEAPITAGPVRFARSMHDFGLVRDGPGKAVTHEFVYTHSGSEPLKVERIKGQCSCVVSEALTELCAPGEEGRIRVTFNPRARQGPEKKTVSVFFAGVAQPAVLTIAANVIPEVGIEPRSVVFPGEISRGQGAEPVGVQFISRRPDLEISEAAVVMIRSTKVHPLFTVEELPWEDDTIDGEAVRRFRYKVGFEGTDIPGRAMGQLRLRTNIPDRPVIGVSVMANVVGEFWVSPDIVSCGSGTPGTTVERTIRVRRRQGGEFQLIEGGFLGDDHLGAKILSLGPDPKMADTFRIVLQVTAPGAGGAEWQGIRRFESILVLRTSLPSEPEIRLPVQMFVNAPIKAATRKDN